MINNFVFFNSFKISKISIWYFKSKWFVGSSRIIIFVSWIKHIAIRTLCCWPPESSLYSFLYKWFTPNFLAYFSIIFLSILLKIPRKLVYGNLPIFSTSNTVVLSGNSIFWGKKESIFANSCFLIVFTSFPLTKIELITLCWGCIKLTSVDLPEPFSPIIE